jgi:hypothetical protein
MTKTTSTDRTTMDDNAPDPHTNPDDAGMPRWVKVSIAIAALVLAALLVMMLLGGNHGPSRHG